jgi:hypothetical protein
MYAKNLPSLDILISGTLNTCCISMVSPIKLCEIQLIEIKKSKRAVTLLLTNTCLIQLFSLVLLNGKVIIMLFF